MREAVTGDRDVAPATIPERLGPCRLIRELGSGGAGSVYLAELVEERPYARMGARVAVKVLHSGLARDAAARERFDREGRLGGTLAEAPVPRTLETGSAGVGSGPGTLLYLIREYVDGRTLRELMGALGTIPEPLLRDLAAKVARGLAALHARSVVHCDLKPSNIAITPDHRVMLLDLGVARELGEPSLDNPGEFLGTMDYAAPEQLCGDGVGPAADLYALGVVLYEAATGTQPFAAGDLPAVLERHLQHVPPKVGQLKAELSPFLQELIARLLEKEPGSRFASAAELRDVLEKGERSAWWTERERRAGSAAPRRELSRIHAGRPTGLIGREAELDLLLSLFREACAGKGRVVLIEGEAGVGKTRLCEELMRRLERQGQDICILHGSSDPGVASSIHGGLARAVTDHLGATDLADLAARLAPYLRVEPHQLGEFAELLLGSPQHPRAEPISAEVVAELFSGLAQALAAERPLVWIAEDLHFATAEGRLLLTAIARVAADSPFLLVVTTRPGLSAMDRAPLERLDATRRLDLGRLSPQAVTDLLRAALGSPAVADRLAGPVAARTDGNPFFIFEVLKELEERGYLQRRGKGSYAVAGEVVSLDVPLSVGSVLEARLAELSGDDRAILEVAAVQGFAFAPDLLARVLSRERLDVLQALARIERHLGVVRAAGAGFEFDRHLLQELLYASLPAALRQEYHGQLAVAIAARLGLGASIDPGSLSPDQAVFLVEHALRGGRMPPSDLLLRALDDLAVGHRGEAVVALADLAVALLGREPGLRAEVRLRQSEACKLLGRREAHEAAVADAVSAAEATSDTALAARAWLARGRMLCDYSAYVEARAALDESVRQAQRAGQRRTEASALEVLGTVQLNQGNLDPARAHFERALGLCAGLAERRLALRASSGLAGALDGLGESARALALYRTAIAGARELGDLRAERRATINLGCLLRDRGEFARAREAFERALAIARTTASRIEENACRINLGHLDLAVGVLSGARAQLTAAFATARAHGFRRQQALTQVNLAALALLEGDLESAAQSLMEALGPSAAFGRASYAGALFFHGELLRARGRSAAALLDHGKALALARAEGLLKGVAETALALGRLHFERGERTAARPLLREAEDLSRRLELADTGPLPAAYLALLGERDPLRIEVPYACPASVRAESHWILHRAGAPGEHLACAQVLLDLLGSHLRGAGLERFREYNALARAVSRARA